MLTRAQLEWIVRAIGAITIVSGAAQVIAPTLVLTTLHADKSPAAQHFFAIVGMFMVLFGGLSLHAVRMPGTGAHVPLLWCGLQKFGASVAVGLGVVNEVFSPLALAVAGFDFLSGVLLLMYRRQRLFG